MTELTLTVISGANAGDRFRFPLAAGDVLHLGRARANDLVIPDPEAAKFHATIEHGSDTILLADLDTHGGTYLMGFPVKREVLRPLDEFRLGRTVLSVDWETKAPEAAQLRSSSRTRPIIAMGLGVLLLLLVVSSLLPARRKASVGPALPRATTSISGSTIDVDANYGNAEAIRFPLPAGALLVEFEARTTVPLVLKRSGTLLGRVALSPNTWERYQLILSDTFPGKEVPLEASPAGRGEWLLRRVRARTLPERNDGCLNEAAALTDVARNAPSGTLAALRMLQSCIASDKVTSPGILIASPVDAPELEQAGEMLREIARQQATAGPADSAHLGKVLSDIAASLDSEIWRVSLGHVRSGVLAARAKNYRQAILHYRAIDQLGSDLIIRSEKGAKEDYRIRSGRIALEKAIPKRVLKRQSHYLKERG